MYYNFSKSPSQNTAPQAVAHRRGGTHRVCGSDKTNSIYDGYNYKELLDTAKERGVYRKDMKKVEMALSLKRDDEEKRRAVRDAVIQRQKREQEAQEIQAKKDAEKQALIKQRHERMLWKQRKRGRGEAVSEDSLDNDQMEAEHDKLNGRSEYNHEPVGQALSDGSWDSTSSESTAGPDNQPIDSDCRLRLFEWPYEHMPLLNPPPRLPAVLVSSTLLDHLPFKVPYAPLKVITTSTKQKLFLPGQKYPPGVNTDYVPILSLRTRNAARNGVLEGVLRKATIERASDWANRTQIQGWNARMYFNLPARNETKNLAETYDKWNKENRSLLRVKGRGDGIPADRRKRHAQRYQIKGRRTAEVYDACQYRPLAMCYVPAYLDFSSTQRDDEIVKGSEEVRSLANLFFIRFPGCDVPHYYFWTCEGEWADPTTSNVAWIAADARPKQIGVISVLNDMSEYDSSMHGRQIVEQKWPRKSLKVLRKAWLRIKKPTVAHDTPSSSPVHANFSTLLSAIEHELYQDGLVATLTKYRTKWTINGKQHAWDRFAYALPTLYPSGQMPLAPPIVSLSGTKLAIKSTTIENDRDDYTLLSPLRGDEARTRDDDALWDVVEADDPSPELYLETEVQQGAQCDTDFHGDSQALYRRSSAVFSRSSDKVSQWLEKISPSCEPLTSMSLPSTPTAKGTREEWEPEYLQASQKLSTLECPFGCADWRGMCAKLQAEHMLSHSKIKRNFRRSFHSNLTLEGPSLTDRPNCRALVMSYGTVIDDLEADSDTPVATRRLKLALCGRSRESRALCTSADANSISAASHCCYVGWNL